MTEPTVEPTVEPTDPVTPTDPVVEPTPPADAPVGDKAEGQPSPEPQPSPSEIRAKQENLWLRKTLADSNKRLQDLQVLQDEVEITSLPAEEQADERIARMQDQLDQQKADLEAQTAHGQWRDYYGNFVGEGDDDPFTTDDPIQWQHNVLTTQQKKIVDLLETVTALKKAQETPIVPKVTAKSGGGTPGVKTIYDYSLDEIQAMSKRIQLGLMDPGDIPPLPPE